MDSPEGIRVLTLINPIWVGDLRTGKKLFSLMTMADIRHLVFFVHAECVLKNWHAEHALKK
jgi:hypothetical protein